MNLLLFTGLIVFWLSSVFSVFRLKLKWDQLKASHSAESTHLWADPRSANKHHPELKHLPQTEPSHPARTAAEPFKPCFCLELCLLNVLLSSADVQHLQIWSVSLKIQQKQLGYRPAQQLKSSVCIHMFVFICRGRGEKSSLLDQKNEASGVMDEWKQLRSDEFIQDVLVLHCNSSDGLRGASWTYLWVHIFIGSSPSASILALASAAVWVCSCFQNLRTQRWSASQFVLCTSGDRKSCLF